MFNLSFKSIPGMVGNMMGLWDHTDVRLLIKHTCIYGDHLAWPLVVGALPVCAICPLLRAGRQPALSYVTGEGSEGKCSSNRVKDCALFMSDN
jgi:hypothetical protein